MCGRFVQYSAPVVYASQFALDSICQATPGYNVAPTQPVLAIRRTEEGKRELVPLRWGLVPSWSKGPDSRYSMINARAETVNSKPAYRNAFKHRRCIIPTEGFYEWKGGKGGKSPYLIRREDSAPFAMAGLWERWRSEEGEALESCTIIVTDANELVRDIHDRMPVILAREDYEGWLDPNNKDFERLQAILTPANPERWTMHPVSRQVNSPRNDGPELLEVAEQADA
jgi:putative SOS response-associated peptidase YedK